MPYEKKWTGDKGETQLRSGKKTSKSSLRIEALGAIDELNSFVGLARVETSDPQIAKFLEDIQRELMLIGADLSAPNYEKIKRVSSELNKSLEESIKLLDKKLNEISNFIIPGETRSAALMHICRAISRRAERRLVSLYEQEGMNEEILKYMNRLSEVFFQLARLENKRANIKEKIWKE